MFAQNQLKACVEAGLQALQAGNVASAIATLQQALALSPHDVEALYLLGVALLQAGEPVKAVSPLEQAASKMRNQPAIIASLAQAYFATERYPQAYKNFRKACELDPKNLQSRLGMAAALAMQGKLPEAEQLLRRLSERFPENPAVWFNLGNALRDQGSYDDATESYRRAVSLKPNFADALNNLANALQSLRRLDEAASELRECLRLAPDFVLAKCNFASVLIDLGRFREAEVACREATASAPDFGLAHAFLGTALGHQGRILEALECQRLAVRLAPRDFKVAESYAFVLTDSGRFREGVRWFSRALQLNPRAFSARWKLCLARLRHGQFGEGWAAYVQRPHPDDLKRYAFDAASAAALQCGLKGRRICILQEQGLGDEIFFLRYIPRLHAAGARITCRTSSKLRSVIERVPEIAEVIAESAEPPDADLVMLAGDLPHALSVVPASQLPDANGEAALDEFHEFRERVSIFWPSIPRPLTLTPRNERTALLQNRLAAFGPPPYLALTWRGGTTPGDQQGRPWMLYKEIALQPLASALQKFSGTLIALQRNPAAGELDLLQAAVGRPVLDLTELNDDLEDMLALLAVVDEYVAVSNTNVHLRAGTGKPTRVLVPCPPDWRWMDAGRTSPWFPGCSIYRQSARGDWNGALADLMRDLSGNATTS